MNETIKPELIWIIDLTVRDRLSLFRRLYPSHSIHKNSEQLKQIQKIIRVHISVKIY